MSNDLDGKILGKIEIRELKVSDVSQQYVEWLNDPEIVKFLESRSMDHTMESVSGFVLKMAESTQDRLFGIFTTTPPTRHIGNIKIGDIDSKAKSAHIGFLIGDKREWGKGYATSAIELATRFAFESLSLQRVWAGLYRSNVGSQKALLRAGWQEVEVVPRAAFVDGCWEDKIILERLVGTVWD